MLPMEAIKGKSELPLPLTGTETGLKSALKPRFLVIRSELPLPLTGTETKAIAVLPPLKNISPNYLYPSRGRKPLIILEVGSPTVRSELPLPLTGTETT